MEADFGHIRVVAGMPMYNEEETIGTVVTMALRYVDEVICIDDGSSDSSARIAEACGAKVIRHRSNQGYGAALKTLFKETRESDADILVVLDSDGQHDTADIPKLIQPIMDEEADFTIGSRFVEGGEGNDMPAYRRLGIKVITAASNLTSDLGIKDTQSGFRAFSRKAIDRLRFDSDGMELSLEMLEDAKEKQLMIQEIPTIIRYDVPKGSNFTAISHGFTVLTWALLSLSQKKPLLTLGIPGLGLLATGAAMGMNTAQGFTTQIDTVLGQGLTAVWIGVLGLALIATGFILQTVRGFLRILLVREFGLD
ncbi:MAG: glycosyltransferase family 2 protein [Candidatus Poseidoniaceae archaeon]